VAKLSADAWPRWLPFLKIPPCRPQPFASRHNSYLQRFNATGEAHILGRTRAVVALTKARTIVPVELTVLQVSGIGAEAIFLGVIRPAAKGEDSTVRVRGLGAWGKVDEWQPGGMPRG
jgi:hypothetical protein